MADVDIGRALAGLGAAFKNEMPAFIQQTRQEDLDAERLADREMALAERRKKTMFEDAYAASRLLEVGDYASIVDLMQDRINILRNTNADPSHSIEKLQLAQRAAAGDQRAASELTRLIGNETNIGFVTGMIRKPEIAERFEDIVLPDGTAGQRSSTTGRTYRISGGSNSTTINNQMPRPMGVIPAGYKANYDENNNIISMEPIEGGPVALQIARDIETAAEVTATELAAQEAATTAETERSLIASESGAQSADIVLQDVGRLRNFVENQGMFTPVTGAAGLVASQLAGTPAGDYKRLQETIKSNAAFKALGEMRAASKTGGALGSITEGELDLLASTIGTLDQGLSKDELLINLNRIEEIYTTIMTKLAETPEIAEQYGINLGQGYRNDSLGLYR